MPRLFEGFRGLYKITNLNKVIVQFFTCYINWCKQIDQFSDLMSGVIEFSTNYILWWCPWSADMIMCLHLCTVQAMIDEREWPTCWTRGVWVPLWEGLSSLGWTRWRTEAPGCLTAGSEGYPWWHVVDKPCGSLRRQPDLCYFMLEALISKYFYARDG